jgi:hypothetical protein
MQQIKLEQLKHQLEIHRGQLEHERETIKAAREHHLKVDPQGAADAMRAEHVQATQARAEHVGRLESVMEGFRQALGGLAAAHAAPRKRTLVRGPDGRATHAIDEPLQ